MFLPYYGKMKENEAIRAEKLMDFTVKLSWRNQYCGVYTIDYNGVTYYLLDNEYYFKRSGLYGYYDDPERFAFYSRAAVELIKYIDFVPDVLHCNDWQSAMAPVYLNKFYRHDALYQPIRTMFTIHNIQYQGQHGLNISWDVLGIPDYHRNVLEYNGDVNMMKAAIQESNIVTTVSPSYAKEIHDPWFAHHLDHAINNKGDRVKIFNRTLGLPLFAGAKKPFTKGVRQALAALEITPQEAAGLGDQIFTDCLACHRAGLRFYLVPPIKDKRDPLFPLQAFFGKALRGEIQVLPHLSFKDPIRVKKELSHDPSFRTRRQLRSL